MNYSQREILFQILDGLPEAREAVLNFGLTVYASENPNFKYPDIQVTFSDNYMKVAGYESCLF